MKKKELLEICNRQADAITGFASRNDAYAVLVNKLNEQMLDLNMENAKLTLKVEHQEYDIEELKAEIEQLKAEGE